jgi:hypothetical protein
MDKVVLYSHKNEDIKVIVEAYFDDLGNLVVEGYDIGKTVEEFLGDSDYEYSSTIAPHEVDKLYLVLGIPQGAKKELLTCLQSRFNTNTCYSELRDFLDQNKIKHEGFSWT